ncbi:PDR/VanB family oxidoreductase [Pseudomonas sp. 5P_5.1_Bac1]|uniref:PDR/VanB family oxidoreductase n=1 Tax=Pseudomonas sp. 5P_5.1_Bac1 TaxID=2971616 RepID=UPI0021C6F4B0|nr:PDR/VanB family oxidoreductase [Pseudomonas sp. 5P_5.1_Bac1]MCU1725306.1 PDR/VanB family oxidoreductase [Pseudomonas sp. 5P_5.1_Bac1]
MIDVRIAAIRELTPVIREYRLEALTGELPGFSAGSHVQVHLPNGRRNAYSLLGDPADRRQYRIAVRHQDASRGGSRFLHQEMNAGDQLAISAPANLFPLYSKARQHLLVAAGIGITPFLAHGRELLRRGEDFELHYAYRAASSDAYLTELRTLLGPRLHEYPSGVRRLDPAALLRDRPLGAHVYSCGPQSLLLAIQEQAAAFGWSPRRVHSEAFAAAQPGQPFRVELVRSGRHLQVSAEQSLLEALEAAGVEVPNLCRGGVCGQCQTPYLKGDVEHRDHVLAAAERTSSLMPCVSRGCGSPILLDI